MHFVLLRMCEYQKRFKDNNLNNVSMLVSPDSLTTVIGNLRESGMLSESNTRRIQ